LNDLTAAMGIGRQSLYDTFGDKHALFLASLDRYREAAEESTLSTLEEAGSPKEAIKAVFEDAVDGLARQAEPRRGCLLANTAVELAPHDPEVGKRISRYVARTEEAFERTIVRGRASGELAARHDPEALARFLVNNLLGLRVLARTGAPRRALEDVARVALGALEG
jgi:TetR/AcrR family transcriptional repressor of nem operon